MRNAVIFFTAALFLSGYAIQQRTLRDLRAAIRQPARPSPKIFLPDRFSERTTELPDGTVVVLHRGEDLDDVLDRKAAAEAQPDVRADGDAAPREVLPAPGARQKPLVSDGLAPGDKDAKPLSKAARRKKIKEEIRKLAEGDAPVYYQRRLY